MLVFDEKQLTFKRSDLITYSGTHHNTYHTHTRTHTHTHTHSTITQKLYHQVDWSKWHFHLDEEEEEEEDEE
jgi:hypothetical protein